MSTTITQSESLTVTGPTQVKCTDWCSPVSIVNKYTVTWSLNKTINTSSIRSSPFKIGNLESYLTIEPFSNKDWMRCKVYLQIISSSDSLPRGKMLMNYQDIDKVKVQGRSEIMIGADTFTDGHGWKITEMNLSRSNRITTTLEFTIWHVADNRTNLNSTPDQSKTILTNYLKLLTDGEFSDVTLKVGEESLEAHKTILASHSPVFAAMLKADMKESKSSEIVIEDIEEAVMKMLLRFIYSGCLEDNSELNKDLMLSLLRAADKYDIPDLRETCSTALVKLISIENVMAMRTVAILHNVDKLKTCSDMFISNNISTVSQTKDWKELEESSPEEALKLLKSALCPQCKQRVFKPTP